MKRILVLGAGFVAEPLVEYLSRRNENQITVASHLLQEAQSLASKFDGVEAIEINVTDHDALVSKLNSCDLVVSLVPAPFHAGIAKACIDSKVSMVTASYESEEMRELSEQIAEAGITVLNEIGLDPGIDHLSAMQIIDDAHEKSEEVVSFVSWCGGLPAPEFNNNPLGYKFSWAPKGVLMALLNEAQYLHQNKAIVVGSDSLMDWAQPLSIADLNLEGYPNRESISYKNVYGIEEAQSILRGTLRYHGFSEIIKGAYQLGLLATEEVSINSKDWQTFVCEINEASEIKDISGNISSDAFEALSWLGCFSDKLITAKSSAIDIFCDLLIEKLQYLENETDMVVLQHKFVLRKPDGKEYCISSTLKAIGEAGGYSAMSKTVGYPAAIAAQLILDGNYKQKGLRLPVTKDIYEPILKALTEESIVCEEKIFDSSEINPSEFLSELN